MGGLGYCARIVWVRPDTNRNSLVDDIWSFNSRFFLCCANYWLSPDSEKIDKRELKANLLSRIGTNKQSMKQEVQEMGSKGRKNVKKPKQSKDKKPTEKKK